jgi:hypothetical protein
MESIVEAAMEEAVDEGAGELTKEAAVLVLRLRNNRNSKFTKSTIGKYKLVQI